MRYETATLSPTHCTAPRHCAGRLHRRPGAFHARNDRACAGIVRTCAGDNDFDSGIVRTCAGDNDFDSGIVRTCAGDDDFDSGNDRSCAGDDDFDSGNDRSCAGDNDFDSGIVRTCAGDDDPDPGNDRSRAGDDDACAHARTGAAAYDGDPAAEPGRHLCEASEPPDGGDGRAYHLRLERVGH